MEENIEQGKTAEQAAENAAPAAEPAQPAVEPVVAPEVKAEVPAEPVPAKEKAKPKIIEGERKWYVIQTLTGQEDKAKSALEQTIVDEGLKERVFQILVPLEETIEIKNGKRLEKVRKMFPGYVFVDMILDEETWYLIRQTSGVARFIGTKVKPTPVSEKEMQRVLKQLGKEEKLEVSFEQGEGVRVISGAFRGYTGVVDEINAEKGKLKVLINIFGRDTPVEVNFEHAQKIN
ncbi:MAG: transcription termination/antitermination protein NusG [Candidatus Margulisiibacteriota bacterium]